MNLNKEENLLEEGCGWGKNFCNNDNGKNKCVIDGNAVNLEDF